MQSYDEVAIQAFAAALAVHVMLYLGSSNKLDTNAAGLSTGSAYCSSKWGCG
jgi:hypothetical protein